MTHPQPPLSGVAAGVPEPHLAARARDALAMLAAEFAPLLHEELTRMVSARDAWRAGAAHDLGVAAHDLKGLAAILGAPLVGRIAASLERLLGAGDTCERLVDAHVDAMAAVVREGAADGRDPLGAALAAALEAAVGERLASRLPQAA